MCNLSQGVEEKGIAKGLARGRAEGRAEATVTLIRNLMDSASISIEKAMSMLRKRKRNVRQTIYPLRTSSSDSGNHSL